MKNWNIRQQLLFLAIAPLFVTIVVMSFIHTIHSVEQFDDEFERKGISLAKQLALTSEFAVLSGNIESISQPVEILLKDKDIVQVKLTDTFNNVLLDKEHSHKADKDDNYHKNVAKYESPIIRSLVNINDDFEQQQDTGSSNQVIGYAHIHLSRASTIGYQRQVLLENIIITLLALSITTYIALLMAKRLSAPLRTVSSTVARIRNGDYSHHIDITSGGELGQLEEGINSLATALDEARKQDVQKTQSLEETNRQLQQEIETRKRVEIELIDAKDRAEAANLAKSEFLANMGHELRTPLNSIIGFNELLLMDELSDDHRSYIQHSFNSSQTLLKLIQDILDFSKLEAGKLSIVSVAFNLRRAIHEVADMLSLQASRKGIDLIIDFPPEMPEHVMGDPGRIRQVLVNLITNAINFTNEGSIEIVVETKISRNDNIDISIAVRDSGQGIPEDKLATIFDRFTQADGSTTRQQQGLGLGLSICKQLIDIMGGTISADSKVGSGSVFMLKLTLPCSYVSENMRKEILMPMSVLLVDGCHKTRDITEKQLLFKGMQVDTSTSFDDACSLVEERSRQFRPYDVIMLDSNCCDDVSSVLEEKMTSGNCLKGIPIILLGNASEVREQHGKLGPLYASLLGKPINPYELTSTLKKLSETALANSGFGKNRAQQDNAENSANATPKNTPHVLVVDDNGVNLKLAVSALHKMGYLASTAGSGHEALDMVKANNYDIILMDILMPDMDGFETTRMIRQYEKDNGLESNVIIALTAKAMTGDREQCLASGMNDYISKPLQLKTLKSVLLNWVDESRFTLAGNKKKDD